MLFEIAATALLFMTIAVYEDGSCMTVVFEAERECRVAAPEIYCPDVGGPCEARDRAMALVASEPSCAMLTRLDRFEERRAEHRKRARRD